MNDATTEPVRWVLCADGWVHYRHHGKLLCGVVAAVREPVRMECVPGGFWGASGKVPKTWFCESCRNRNYERWANGRA